MSTHAQFDAVVVGSGPGGATVARELSKRGGRVLILERGSDAPVDGFFATTSVLNAVRVGDKLSMARAFTAGGTTAVYFAVADEPPLGVFRSLGVDLLQPLDEARNELPLTVLPDEMLAPQSLRVRDSALQMGLPWKKNRMLIDLALCGSGYTAAAKWNARSYLREAIARGAAFVPRARVLKVLTEGRRAVGVEYSVGKEVRQAFGERIVLAAGGAASPNILRNSGMSNIARDGFYIHPSFSMYATVRGLKAEQNFVANAKADLDGDLSIGDANFDRAFYRMLMLGIGKWFRALLHSKTIAVGVMVRDALSGALGDDGRYHKELSREERAKLDRGAEVARQILTNAGGRNLYTAPVSGSHVGGTIRLREHLDETLQTEWRNLHVCDGSVIPETAMVTPTLTLVCLGKYLADRLAR